MDLLFASKSPFVWDEERHFQKLKAQGVGQGARWEEGSGSEVDEVPSTDGVDGGKAGSANAA